MELPIINDVSKPIKFNLNPSVLAYRLGSERITDGQLIGQGGSDITSYHRPMRTVPVSRARTQKV